MIIKTMPQTKTKECWILVVFSFYLQLFDKNSDQGYPDPEKKKKKKTHQITEIMQLSGFCISPADKPRN